MSVNQSAGLSKAILAIRLGEFSERGRKILDFFREYPRYFEDVQAAIFLAVNYQDTLPDVIGILETEMVRLDLQRMKQEDSGVKTPSLLADQDPTCQQLNIIFRDIIRLPVPPC